jgi:N-methylhydantoinase B
VKPMDSQTTNTASLDPVLTTVIANRIDGAVREMSNTLLRAARSGCIAVARDFSCALVTADNRLLSSAEGLPVHVFGSHLQTQAMTSLHKDIREGDAFLHNDPYLGNTHSADQTVLVPIFIDGVHMFTACAKAHQADIGNSIPTTYHAGARDVYEEGAVIFPCVRLQRDYETIDDVVRIGKRRIRVPEQWYGDLLAAIGSARIGERRMKELCAKYGADVIRRFIEDWFDYSERRAAQAIRELPAADVENEGHHDAIPPILTEPVRIHVKLHFDPAGGRISVDLRDNVDCLPCGLNESEACAMNNALTGVFNCLDATIPHNAGSFRRIEVLLRDGCAVGKPKFPHSASVATTNFGERIISIVQGAFAKLGIGFGLAEGANSHGPAAGVISGTDFRRRGAPYVNQMIIMANGGPAGPIADGWVTYGGPVGNGLQYRDSIELDEVMYPLIFSHAKVAPGSGGAGRRRGGPAQDVAYGPRRDSMTVVYVCDNTAHAPKGAHGGHSGRCAENTLLRKDGSAEVLPGLATVVLEPGEFIRSIEASGGGYGNPIEREAERVLLDVIDGFETVDRARELYGVVLTGQLHDGTLAVDGEATAKSRKHLVPRRRA